MKIGARLRRTRTARGVSLRELARRSGMSVSSLSRIENDKQSIDLTLFVHLARILEFDPAEAISENGDAEAEGSDPLIRRIAVLSEKERVAMWHKLAELRRQALPVGRRSAVHQLSLQVEELMAQLDLLQAEIESVRRRLRNRSR